MQRDTAAETAFASLVLFYHVGVSFFCHFRNTLHRFGIAWIVYLEIFPRDTVRYSPSFIVRNVRKNRATKNCGIIAYMSVIVQLIVREFQLVEGNRLLHPVGSVRRAIGMYVDSGGWDRICSTSNYPGAAVKRVSVPLVVAGHEIHHQQIVDGRIQAKESAL